MYVSSHCGAFIMSTQLLMHLILNKLFKCREQSIVCKSPCNLGGMFGMSLLCLCNEQWPWPQLSLQLYTQSLAVFHIGVWHKTKPMPLFFLNLLCLFRGIFFLGCFLFFFPRNALPILSTLLLGCSNSISWCLSHKTVTLPSPFFLFHLCSILFSVYQMK